MALAHVIIAHAADEADARMAVLSQVAHERLDAGAVVGVDRRDTKLRDLHADRDDGHAAGLDPAQVGGCHRAQECDHGVDMVQRVRDEGAGLVAFQPFVALPPLRPGLDGEGAATRLLRGAMDAQQDVAEELVAQERAEDAKRQWSVRAVSMEQGCLQLR